MSLKKVTFFFPHVVLYTIRFSNPPHPTDNRFLQMTSWGSISNTHLYNFHTFILHGASTYDVHGFLKKKQFLKNLFKKKCCCMYLLLIDRISVSIKNDFYLIRYFHVILIFSPLPYFLLFFFVDRFQFLSTPPFNTLIITPTLSY